LGVFNEEPAIVRRAWPAHSFFENLPQIGPLQLLRNPTSHRGHHERAQVWPVPGFIDADDPWHDDVLLLKRLIHLVLAWYLSHGCMSRKRGFCNRGDSSMMQDNIFQKIIDKKIPAAILHEDE